MNQELIAKIAIGVGAATIIGCFMAADKIEIKHLRNQERRYKYLHARQTELLNYLVVRVEADKLEEVTNKVKQETQFFKIMNDNNIKF